MKNLVTAFYSVFILSFASAGAFAFFCHPDDDPIGDLRLDEEEYAGLEEASSGWKGFFSERAQAALSVASLSLSRKQKIQLILISSMMLAASVEATHYCAYGDYDCCEEDYFQCDDNLIICENDLFGCQSSLSGCRAGSYDCYSELSTCETLIRTTSDCVLNWINELGVNGTMVTREMAQRTLIPCLTTNLSSILFANVISLLAGIVLSMAI